MRHPVQLIFVFLVEMGFHRVDQACLKLLTSEMGLCHVGQTGLELLTSGSLPTSASQSAGITGVSHCAHPGITFKELIVLLSFQYMVLRINLVIVSTGDFLPFVSVETRSSKTRLTLTRNSSSSSEADFNGTLSVKALQGWRAVALSRLSATPASCVQAILSLSLLKNF
ncbi:hypothetical protein AAY473_000282 [Plecturocebus cupreus]